jgi:hypothetical protein
MYDNPVIDEALGSIDIADAREHLLALPEPKLRRLLKEAERILDREQLRAPQSSHQPAACVPEIAIASMILSVAQHRNVEAKPTTRTRGRAVG